MIYGLYLSAQGAQQQSTRLDAVANNLANASTNAFKRDLAIFQAHRPFDVEHGSSDDPPGNLNEMTGGLSPAEVATDFSEGPAVSTGGALDVALSGPGFLRVSDGSRDYLTRDGRLTVNSKQQLVNASGLRVLGTGGDAITVPAEARDIEISADGGLWTLDAAGNRAQFGQLAVVTPQSLESLQKVGDSLYQSGSPTNPATGVRVRQGFLEGSGVNPVKEMLAMIEASRSFETNVNMIRAQDESLGQLLQMSLR